LTVKSKWWGVLAEFGIRANRRYFLAILIFWLFSPVHGER